jgi:lipopolysaccharide transport system ATP-binding protein
MSDIAIRVDNLGKLYRIGGKKERYRTLRDTMTGAATAPLRVAKKTFKRSNVPTFQRSNDKNTIWALKDISFEVKQGDVVGVIGRNGAGKSTLLKVLSRITDPTEGSAEIHGRVGSLLEVGTGFHPELTGRENIYLNGAILGMKRAEINSKFDEIVDFAEVEKFIDTPVKHYSSGMYLRLAFAVAAHLEPEILLVDEVLAVGDAAFQNKCVGKMGDVAKQGRTILFVSHNMGAVRSLCNKGMLLTEGKVSEAGDLAKSIEMYYKAIGVLKGSGAEGEGDADSGSVFGPVVLGDGQSNTASQADALDVSTTLRVKQPITGFSLFCIVEDMQGRQIFHLREESPDLGFDSVPTGKYNINLKLPPLWLVPGLYSIYFKAKFWGDYGSAARYISDKFPLDISGNTSRSREAILHQEGRWQITSL